MTHLRLVDSIDSDIYSPEYIYTHNIQDRENAQDELSNVLQDLAFALTSVDITKFKLIPYTDCVRVHLTNQNDFQKFSVMMDEDAVRQDFFEIPNDVTGKKVTALRNELRTIIDATELKYKIDVRADHPNRRVVVEAVDNLAFLKYCALMDGTAEQMVPDDNFCTPATY